MVARAKFAAGCAVTLASAGVARTAKAAQYSWKIGLDLDAGHPITVRMTEAVVRLRQETKGQFDVRVFPNSALGGPLDMLNQLREGALEMMSQAGGTLDNIVPLASIENVAFAFPNRRVAFAAMDGDLGAAIRAAIMQKGMVVIGRVFENGYREFTTSNRPIRTVDDLQGMRLRVSPGKLRVDTFRSLGVAVTPISPQEVYVALQTHIVDGQETALITIEAQRYYEVQKYCSLSHHMWSGYWGLVNAEKWNSLPPALQAMVDKAFSEAALAERHDDDLQLQSIQDKLHRQGMTFNTIPPVEIARFRAKLVASDYYRRWRNEFGQKAWDALEKYSGPLH